MRKFILVFAALSTVLTLGLAMGADSHHVARQAQIEGTPSAEILKVSASQIAMMDRATQPDMPTTFEAPVRFRSESTREIFDRAAS